MGIEPAPLPPKEALAFLRAKGVALSFNWKDLWQEEHAAAFTVAKAMNLDLLSDIRGAVDEALAKGQTIRQFRKKLEPLLQKKGWWGRKTVKDPKTGKTVAVQLGSRRRLQTIYDTNMRMARAAGQWDRIERIAKKRPYLRYVAVLDNRTRETHRNWHGTILPVGHPFWETHYPPNGWRCRCTTVQLSKGDLKKYGWGVSRPPAVKKIDWLNRRTGEMLKVPKGISPGFAYNVGRARLRAITPPPLGGLPSSFPPGTEPPRLPPNLLARLNLLPEELAEKEYAKRFLKQFGLKPGQKGLWRDPTGQGLIISEDLFKDATGAWKITKGGRHRYLLYLAEAIKNPQEIWWAWEKGVTDGVWRLRRRYIARFEAAKGLSGIAVFDYGKEGWLGVSTFVPRGKSVGAQENYLNKWRTGLLAWRKK